MSRITELVSEDGTSDYTYDPASQLTGANHTYQTDESYSYDANGNRTMTGYSTGTNNRLLSDGVYNYEYDDEGNRTKKTTIARSQTEKLAAIHTANLETGRAWAIKETLRDLWNHGTVQEATTFFSEWYSWAIRSRLNPVKVARMVKQRVNNVVSYCRYWITNAVSEGLNSKIMSIKRLAGGFRNIDNFKTAIYFHCGGLDLHPR